MKNALILLVITLIFFACETTEKSEETTSPVKQSTTIALDIAEANRLAAMPMECIDTEFPYKMGNVLNDSSDLQTPRAAHPAFYGCFDWHSAVHGHWSLVRLIKAFPELDQAEHIKQKLAEHLSKENIAGEVAYFDRPFGKNFERTYGWAWLLKLAEELHTWDDPIARELESNLQPLTDVLIEKYITYYPKLNYPIRVGTHTNTAFGMTFAWDYANTVGHEDLKASIASRAKHFYQNDSDCPLSWEPSGHDFLSPCLEELDIMRRVLSKEEFLKWVDTFLPTLKNADFNMATGVVSDRTDGHLVHLDGVNFSRAWCLYALANQYEEFAHLKTVADEHVAFSLPSIVDGNYEGTHWLGSFAIYALSEKG